MKKRISILLAISVLACTAASCSGNKNKPIFSTEYEIEDYCEDAIIVSKSDGTVYGLLNNKGKEILPLDYDDLDFANKSDYTDSKCDNLYISADREEYVSILTTDGKEVLKSSDSLSYMNFDLDCAVQDNLPYFRETIRSSDKTAIEKYKFYNEKGELLSEVNARKKLGDTIWLSNKCYIDWSIADTIVYGYNGEELHRFDKGLAYKFHTDDTYNLYLANYKSGYKVDGNELEEVVIDADGNILSDSIIPENDYIGKYNDYRKNSKSSKKYNLYQSNGTWKLEDWDGNTLYDERYFERLNAEGKNNCLALTNEDNQICIIGRNGGKYIDFGILEYDDKKVFMSVSDEERFEVQTIYEGKESLIIPIKQENGFDIYYFNGN